MNVSLSIEQVKWMIDAKNYSDAMELAQQSITYLANYSREYGGDYIVPAYLPIFGEWIMTSKGRQKRVLRYDKKETKSVDYWKERLGADTVLLKEGIYYLVEEIPSIDFVETLNEKQ